MERGHPGIFVFHVSKTSQEVITVASKTENTVQHAIGWSSIRVPSRTLVTKRCGWRVLNEVRQSGVASEICFQPWHPDTGLVSQLREN